MKIRNLFLYTVVIAVAASCSNGDSSKSKETTLDACTCASIKDQFSEDFKKCKDLRIADAKFEADYQKCKLAESTGIGDTSKIEINKGSISPNINPVSGGTYTVDTEISKIAWMGENITGKKHKGTVSVKSGSFVIENGELVKGEIIMDMSSINVADLTGDGKAKLEGHLKSDDFFATAKHPEAKYVVKSATAKGNVEYEIIGNLTIKGITKEAKTNLIIAPNRENGASIAGGLLFDRSQFDVRYGSDKFFDNLGDDLIKNDVILTVDLKAKK